MILFVSCVECASILHPDTILPLHVLSAIFIGAAQLLQSAVLHEEEDLATYNGHNRGYWIDLHAKSGNTRQIIDLFDTFSITFKADWKQAT